MNPREIKEYLLSKRKFTAKRIVSISIINLLFSIGTIIILFINQYVFLAILVSIISALMSSYTIMYLSKTKNSYFKLYLSASLAMLHVYLIFNFIFYSLLSDYIDIYIFFTSLTILSLLLTFAFYFIIRNRIKSKKIPKFAYSESLWFVIVAIIAVTVPRMFSLPFFDGPLFSYILIAFWVVVGPYTYVDLYMSSKLYLKLESGNRQV